MAKMSSSTTTITNTATNNNNNNRTGAAITTTTTTPTATTTTTTTTDMQNEVVDNQQQQKNIVNNNQIILTKSHNPSHNRHHHSSLFTELTENNNNKRYYRNTNGYSFIKTSKLLLQNSVEDEEDFEDHGICADSYEILNEDYLLLSCDDDGDISSDIPITTDFHSDSMRFSIKRNNLRTTIEPPPKPQITTETLEEEEEFDPSFDDNTSDLTSSPPPPSSPSKLSVSSSPCCNSSMLLNSHVEASSLQCPINITQTITSSSSSLSPTSSQSSSYANAAPSSFSSLSSSSSSSLRIQPNLLFLITRMIQQFGGSTVVDSSMSSLSLPSSSPPAAAPPVSQTLTSNLPKLSTSGSTATIPAPPPLPPIEVLLQLHHHHSQQNDSNDSTTTGMRVDSNDSSSSINHHHHYQPSVSSIRDAVSHLTRLDDFNVVKLSQGFFSQVFKVIHFSTKKTMVLKMNKEVGNRVNALKEVELLNKLNHPNIVAYMGTVVHEGALHPLLEYINGGTLEQMIKQFYTKESLHLLDGGGGPESSLFTASTTVNVVPIRNGIVSPKIHLLQNCDRTFMRLMRDVARGMDYLHSSGYLHRDLASKNVFIRKLPIRQRRSLGIRARDLNNNNSNNGQMIGDDDPTSKRICQIDDYLEDYFDDDRMVAVIGDFGFATTEPSPEQKLSPVGSPYWLAPECFKKQWYNHKCDIYSFGVMCCELNWRVPADPDYLPRMEHFFAVDFDQLSTRKDTLLAKIAQLSCQIDPNRRPEFTEIVQLFDAKLEELDDLDFYEPDHLDNEFINDDNGSRGLDDHHHHHRHHHHDQSYNRSQFVFRRGNSLDSSLYSGWFNNKAHGDVFDQHLLRRQLSAVYNRCSMYNYNNLHPRRLNHSKSSNCS